MEATAMVTDNLRRRVDASKRGMATAHPRIIRNARYEAVVRTSADLERRMLRIERFIRALQDVVLGLISSAFAFAAVMYFGGIGFLTEATASAVLAFLIVICMASIFFRNARAIGASGASGASARKRTQVTPG
jgi:hypothetical protein